MLLGVRDGARSSLFIAQGGLTAQGPFEQAVDDLPFAGAVDAADHDQNGKVRAREIVLHPQELDAKRLRSLIELWLVKRPT